MTRRQQLILFALGLATVSTCTVAFAMAMSLSRNMALASSSMDRPSVMESETVRGMTWQMPPTPQPVVPPTATQVPTPTNTRVPTWTPSPTSTPTATRVPTDTPVPTPTHTPPPAPVAPEDSAPALTAAVPEPTPTPTPEFPFDTMLHTFDTGTPQMTRITGMVWRIVNLNLAEYEGEPGYQMRLVDPNGGQHLSSVSGIGGTDSTCLGCGDNQRMNMKLEIPPYVPGTYRMMLVREEEQMSPELEFTLGANPQQYVHVDFVPLE